MAPDAVKFSEFHHLCAAEHAMFIRGTDRSRMTCGLDISPTTGGRIDWLLELVDRVTEMCHLKTNVASSKETAIMPKRESHRFVPNFLSSTQEAHCI